MTSLTEFEALLEQIDRDGMVVRQVQVEAEDVVYLKGVIEAYPGVAAVHAERGQAGQGAAGFRRPRTLVVATTAGLGGELDQLLEDLRGELSLVIDGVRGVALGEDRAAR